MRDEIAKPCAAYPRTFFKRSADRKPLKVGIFDELAEAKVMSRTKLRYALAYYCGSISYLESVIEGAERIGLDGNVAGHVYRSDAADAAEKIRVYRQHWHEALAHARKSTAESSAPEKRAAAPAPKRLGLADLRQAAQRRQMVTT